MRRQAVVFALALNMACSGRTDDGAAGGTGGTAPTGGSDASLDGSGGRGGNGASTGSGGAAGIDASTGGGGNGGTSSTTGSGGSSGAGTTGGAGGTGGSGGFAGNIIIEDFWPPTDTCITSCDPIGGQFCGRISDQCGRFLDCLVTCKNPVFTCGGRGQPNVCGAALDSGLCTPTVCQQPTGKYCGKVGDGCGGTVDCGGCPPEQTCGGGGVVGLCAYPLDSGACHPLSCTSGTRRFCGDIGDGCGRQLSCGLCEGDNVCGVYQPNVCGTPCPLCNQIATCEGGTPTTLRGTAVTAAGTGAHPLPQALVYIPNLAPGKTLPPLDIGRSCLGCPALTQESAVSAAATGIDGTFTLTNVPVGNTIPLIIELGKWRRFITVDVQPCTDNVLPAGTVRLPRNRAEGDIPQTAVVTGDSDRLQCLLRKMGVDDAEFTNPTGSGRIHLYRANGSRIDANTPDVPQLITGDGGTEMQRYSDILFACRGMGVLGEPSSFSQLRQYVFSGGNVLGTHLASSWLSQGDPLSTIGTWTPTAPVPSSPLIGTVNINAFPAGASFAKWLELVGALSSTMPPQIAISAPAADLAALNPDGGGGAVAWISSNQPATAQLVTFDTPFLSSTNGKCGRVLFSDFHVAATATSNAIFPAECDADMAMTPEEKALEFMILGLGACVPSNKGFPPPPSPIPRPPDPPPPPGPSTPFPPTAD